MSAGRGRPGAFQGQELARVQVQVPKATEAKLSALQELTGMTRAQVIVQAIDFWEATEIPKVG